MRRILLATLLILASSACRDMALYYYNRGLDAMSAGASDSAVTFFEKSIALRDHDVDAHFNLGVAYHASGDYEKALQKYQWVLQVNPDDPELHYNMGEVNFALGNVPSAIREYENALRLNPDFVEAMTSLGKLYLDTGSYELAEEQLVHAMTIKPSYNRTYVYLGILYARTDRHHQASFYLLRALKHDPQNIDARLGLADSFFSRKLYEDALADYERVYARDPANTRAALGVGLCHISLGHATQAERILSELITGQPEFPEAYKALGDIYFDRKNYGAALANYRMAVQQRDDFADAYIQIGRIFEETEQPDDARDAYEKALFSDPASSWARYYLGRFWAREGDTVQAESYLRSVMENAASLDEVRRMARELLQELPGG